MAWSSADEWIVISLFASHGVGIFAPSPELLQGSILGKSTKNGPFRFFIQVLS